MCVMNFYVSMYVSMNLCMYACMYACMYMQILILYNQQCPVGKKFMAGLAVTIYQSMPYLSL